MNNWNVYPRPMLKRENNFQILNDFWKLNDFPIKVPFPPESKLAEYKGPVTQKFTYYRDFEIPEAAETTLKAGGKLFLYFGAIDQVSTVFVENEIVGHSELGYFKLTCDVTEQANKALNNGKKIIQIKVEGEDFLDHTKPYGKQKTNRGGMWYTPISGIWQTVWCEWVPEEYITKINYTAEGTKVRFTIITGEAKLEEQDVIRGKIHFTEGEYEFSFTGNTYELDLSEVKLKGASPEIKFWSCENPHLYPVEFEFKNDKVQSYFALRTVSIKNIDGQARICINEEPVFLNGVLDQGYYENGIFTPETPEEYQKDILRMKELGFNTLRKHIKVEPEIFYYECDRLGMYVIQDMVNNGPYNFFVDTALATFGLKLKDKNRYKDENQKKWFKLSAFETQNMLNNNPCVIGYTVFNEGWGQTDSDQIGDELKEKDSSRFYDYTSGWFKQNHSDVDSVHIYFRTKKLSAGKKPLLLSEFGGFTREIPDHMWNTEKSYGYGKCKDEKSLTDKIIQVYEKMVVPAIPKGLCSCIYTQLSDIEDEINGFYTYDRQICKVDKNRLREFMKKL